MDTAENHSTEPKRKLVSAIKCQNNGCPPIWIMRQAGRYHKHYQNIRKKHSFLEICKTPEIAAEVAKGPIDEFDFDAAILFSDILFPIEAMGVELNFDPGPVFSNYLLTREDLKSYKIPKYVEDFFSFQKDALDKTRQLIGDEKSLITFVGGPFTLYYFAAAGRKKEYEKSVIKGLYDGRFEDFMEKVTEMIKRNISVQLKSDVDTIAILDTSAGILSLEEFQKYYYPFISDIFKYLKFIKPQIPVIYYAKGLTESHYKILENEPINCFGIDHSHDLKSFLKNYNGKFAIQGNLPPETLTKEPKEAKFEIDRFLEEKLNLPKEYLKGWICGLGHGVTPKAKEENVKYFVNSLRHKYMEKFS